MVNVIVVQGQMLLSVHSREYIHGRPTVQPLLYAPDYLLMPARVHGRSQLGNPIRVDDR